MTDHKNHNKTIGSLKKRADFLRVQSADKKWVTKSFIIRQDTRNKNTFCETDIRYGLTVTKKIFKNATDRNRVKRRLRAVVQKHLPEIGDTNSDYVFIGRKDTKTRDFKDIENDLKWAIKRLSS